MIHPLVTLWRHHAQVTFYEGVHTAGAPGGPPGGVMPAAQSPAGRRLTWSSRDDAAAWLRFWLGQAGAMAELLWMVRRGSVPIAGPRRGADDALGALAARLVSGEIIVMEEAVRLMTPARLSPAPSASAAASLSALPALASVPSVPNPQALLPALEEVQIEGAQVRPELEDGLAQVGLSVGQLGQASASLKPAPSKVSDITAAMQAAAAQASDDLGAL